MPARNIHPPKKTPNLTAAPASMKKGSNGTQAFPSVAQRTMTASPVAANAPAQLFPYQRTNRRTNRTFRITNVASELRAVEINGDPDDIHSGYCSYTIENDNSITLGHIASDPEEGTGIGSLLTLFLVEIAEANGKTVINIPTAAPTAIGFYELLGFVSANQAGSSTFEAMLAGNSDQIALAVERWVSLRARIEYDSDPENHKFKRRSVGPAKTQLKFDSLTREQQLELEEAQMIKFGTKTDEQRQQIITTMLHGKAVGMYGMTGAVAAIKTRATAQCTRWTAWTQQEEAAVWASRNSATLTEFPRRDDD